MPLRISTGLRNFLARYGSLRDALEGGRIDVYSGTQPTSGDAAVTGTLLTPFTRGSALFTAETPATATITLNSGSSGSIDDVTIDGVSILDSVVSYATSLANTASLLAAALNRSSTNTDWRASASGAVVTLTAQSGLGTRHNGKTLTSTVTTLTKTDVNPSGGAYSSNGLRYELSGDGTLAIRTGDAATGVTVAQGTAGYFRAYGPASDAGGADSSGLLIRLDGAIATSGAQLNMNPTLMVLGATQTLGSFAPRIPASL